MRVAVACIATTLAACGGGGDAATASSTQAGIGTGDAAKRVRILEADGDTWTTVAQEGQHFAIVGTQTVRYGIGEAWITLSITGDADCTNQRFGNDPAYGIVKQCQVASTSAGWTRIATEGSSFTLSGSQTVRYGSGNSWVTMTMAGAGDCSNAFFGTDPLYGVAKECQVASTPASWTKIANEGSSFMVSGSQTVRYGSGNSWITMTVSGGGDCSNAFFGRDPLYGIAKECDVASAPITPPPTAAMCTPPVAAADTSGSVATVGNGSPGSCTEGALRAAVNANSVVKFNCGPAPATIAIASTIDLPTTRDTVIDGENRITLDGGGNARIFRMWHPNYRTNPLGLTLQHIALRNAKAPTAGYVAPNPANPACAYGYDVTGGGAAIAVQDARLHVIDVDFQNNAAASPGPDVGGGAIYALGSLDVTISGSRFTGNTASNSGAVGLLQTNVRIYNSSFTGNSATGIGMNYRGSAVDSCPGVGHAGQGGAGGSGGALGIDGDADGDVTVCGTTFTGNRANELAGAMGRTPNGAPRRTSIDRSAFYDNVANQGGAVYLMNSAPLDIIATTFSGNRATLFGAAHLESNQVNIVNSTFSGNEATHGVGGAIFLNGSWGPSVILNSTFADNKANGGPGYFSAAIFGDSHVPILNTVFSNNTTADPWNPMQCTFGSAPGSGDVQWPPVRPDGSTDNACVVGITFVDPLLGALADNTGPTLTRLPAANSPLRNAGRDCPATDQRGNPRNPSSCTIGAVE